ncbi:MAG: L-serine ammonia-lyase, iron-sulfur-dependent subunit beta [Nocardiopsis sp. BM-2018]|nr:MAG: L-serine ammonia-lyase, iron-sulfur-dependent subunit beta [Nocardiopsis sp. BM-2018]
MRRDPGTRERTARVHWRIVSLLDVIGPVMVGPSSSHTAGACRLALLARHALACEPSHARFVLHGSFAKTARGHGTDLALVAGALGAAPDDPRIPTAFDEAARAGLGHAFETADLGDVHPNSVRVTLRGVDGGVERTVTLLGSSLGGGLVRVFELDGFRIEFSGGTSTLLVRHVDTPGVIARVTRVIADDEVNVASLYCARKRKGGEAMMAVECDRPISEVAAAYLLHLPSITWVRQLPAVMSASSDGQHVASATAEVAS